MMAGSSPAMTTGTSPVAGYEGRACARGQA
jgi:hypothetical protein